MIHLQSEKIKNPAILHGKRANINFCSFAVIALKLLFIFSVFENYL
jgi:hypothetical protein